MSSNVNGCFAFALGDGVWAETATTKKNNGVKILRLMLSVIGVVEPLVPSAYYVIRRLTQTPLQLFSAIQIANVSAMAHVKIETIKHGPYIVTGEVELIDADGNKFPVEKRMALCRCGASTEKPFCDGTHSKIGFKAAEKAVPESKE
jgi:CDGSH-type Zn-finger protein